MKKLTEKDLAEDIFFLSLIDLKLKGIWESEENKIINSNIDSTIYDFSIYMDEFINHSNNSFITEAGDIENWVGSTKSKMIKNKEEAIEYLKKLKK